MKGSLRVMAIGFLLFHATEVRLAYAQLSEAVAPYSRKEEVTVPSFREFVCDHLRAADQRVVMFGAPAQGPTTREGDPYVFGDVTSVAFNLENSGTWQQLSNGGRLWRLAIRSPDAQSMRITYNAFHLPPGGTLHLYDEAGVVVLGAFTSRNNKGTPEVPSAFGTRYVNTNEVTLEYYEPPGGEGVGRLAVDNVYHAREKFFVEGIFSNLRALPCHNNVICGDEWRLQRNSVFLLLVGRGLCSATLVNNEENDGHLYVLTAAHCIDDTPEFSIDGAHVAEISRSLLGAIAYWEFQAEDCEGQRHPSQELLTSKTTAGFRLLSFDRYHKDVYVDFAVLELLESPLDLSPPVHPYFSGWDRNFEQAGEMVGIHHPRGNIKKISFGNSDNRDLAGRRSRDFLVRREARESGEPGIVLTDLVPTSDISQSTHYDLVYVEGTIEGGSSGSPLFNASGRQIGVLSTGRGDTCAHLNARQAIGSYISVGRIFSATGGFGSTSIGQALTPNDRDATMTITGRDTCNIPGLFASKSDYLESCGPDVTAFSWESLGDDYRYRFDITLSEEASEVYWAVSTDDEVENSNQLILESFDELHVLNSGGHVLSLPREVPIPFFLEHVAPVDDLVFINLLLKSQRTGHFSRIQSFLVEDLQQVTDVNAGGGDGGNGKAPTAVALSRDALADGPVVYPNPVRDFLFIKTGTTPAHLRIQNTAGADVLNTPYAGGSVALSHLPRGVYVLRLSFADGSEYTQSLLKE